MWEKLKGTPLSCVSETERYHIAFKMFKLKDTILCLSVKLGGTSERYLYVSHEGDTKRSHFELAI
jgi:hypothetical protein